MVWQVHRYLFGQHARSVLIVLGTLLTIVWLAQALRLFNMLMDSAAPLGMTLKLLLLLIPSLLSPLLPLCLFLGLMLSFQRLQQDREWVAMQALGVGRFSLAASALLVAFLAFALQFMLVWQWAPISQRELRFEQQALANNYAAALLKTGTFSDAGEKLTIFVRARLGTQKLQDVFIHDMRNPKETVTITAKEGMLDNTGAAPQMVIYHGVRQNYQPDPGRVSWLSFDRYTLDLDWSQLRDQLTPKTREVGAKKLWKEMRDPSKVTPEIRDEWLQRWSQPLAIWGMVSLAVGAALLAGAPRQSRSWPRTVLLLSALALQLVLLSTTQLAGHALLWWAVPFGLPLALLLGIGWIIWIGPYLGSAYANRS